MLTDRALVSFGDPEPMKYFQIEETREGLTLEETVRGRMAAALGRFAVTFPLVLAGLSFFYIPDYIGRYRAEEPVVGIFWAVVFGFALLIGFVLAALRFVRLERWVFNRQTRELSYETQGIYGPGQGASVGLEKILSAEVQLRSPPFHSLIVFELADGHRETVARSRVSPEEIKALAERLEAFFGKLNLAVTWTRKVD